jgi:UDP-glucose 4-epimerase
MPSSHWFERIAVTGGTGFIGRHLVRALIENGACPALLTRSPRSIMDWSDAVRCVPMDLADSEAIPDILAAEKPDLLFHLAGTRGRGHPLGDSVACAELNVCGTVRILDAARRAGVRRIVMISSADVFGGASGPLDEDVPLQPTSPYGISMATAARFAQAMHAAEGCPVVVLRAFSVYGPGQPGDMFVASAVSAAVEGLPFRMTEGWQRRDLVFVDDVVTALLEAARTPGIEGRVIHIGSGQAHRLRDLATLIWRLTESSAPLMIGARPAPAHELHDTWADISLARRLLGWEPGTELETGLRATIDWARERSLAQGRI